MNIDSNGQSMQLIDISNLNKGLYILKLKSANAEGVVRFIKK
jgi:hypothetical protein